MQFSSPGDPSDASQVSNDASAQAAQKSTWVSVGVNLILSAAQMVGGLLAGSQALLADGVHSLSDLVADFVVLVANHQGQKAPDEDHPYGHHRFETGASLALGLLLLGVGAGMLWQSVHRLETPGQVPQVSWAALWMALLALVAKESLFRYMLAVAKRVRSSLLVANAWHARSDAASSLVVALGILGNLFGYPIFDPIAAAIVGFMVGRMGWTFGWTALHELMDQAADEQEVQSIRTTLIETPGVLGVHDVRTRKMGDMIVVDAHLEVNADSTVEAGHEIAVAAQHRVLAKHRVIHMMTHVDPWRRPDLDHTAPPELEGKPKND
jgi:cation diffusion facilitator family transporter